MTTLLPKHLPTCSWNPFRKKSGLARVVHAQTKKNRVVSKHGRLNIVTSAEDSATERHRHPYLLSTSIICSIIFIISTQAYQGFLHHLLGAALVMDTVQVSSEMF